MSFSDKVVWGGQKRVRVILKMSTRSKAITAPGNRLKEVLSIGFKAGLATPVPTGSWGQPLQTERQRVDALRLAGDSGTNPEFDAFLNNISCYEKQQNTTDTMSVTDATTRTWIDRKREMACTSREPMNVCVGQHVRYFDKHINATRIVEIVNIGPLMPTDAGLGEPASVTIRFEDGSERNTILSRLRPIWS